MRIRLNPPKKPNHKPSLEINDQTYDRDPIEIFTIDFKNRLQSAIIRFRAENEFKTDPLNDNEIKELLIQLTSGELGELYKKTGIGGIVPLIALFIMLPHISIAIFPTILVTIFQIKIYLAEYQFKEFINECLSQEIPIATYIEVIETKYYSAKETIRLEIQAIESLISNPESDEIRVMAYEIQRSLACKKLENLEIQYKKIRQRLEELNSRQTIQQNLPDIEDSLLIAETPTSITEDTQQELAQTVGQALAKK